MGQKKEDKKYILMPVEPSEAAEGAYEDVYRPLTKEEAKHKTWLSRFWLILLVLFVVSGLAYAGYRLLSTGNTESRSGGSPPLRVRSVYPCLDEALLTAKQWHSDAVLVEIQAGVVPYGQSGDLSITYNFISSSDDEINYQVTSSVNGCQGRKVRFSIPNYGAIKFDEKMIDSVEAASIGYYNGGNQFTGRNVVMRVQFRRDDPEVVGSEVWTAYIAGQTGSQLFIVIDPYTGEVIRIE